MLKSVKKDIRSKSQNNKREKKRKEKEKRRNIFSLIHFSSHIPKQNPTTKERKKAKERNEHLVFPPQSNTDDELYMYVCMYVCMVYIYIYIDI